MGQGREERPLKAWGHTANFCVLPLSSRRFPFRSWGPYAGPEKAFSKFPSASAMAEGGRTVAPRRREPSSREAMAPLSTGSVTFCLNTPAKRSQKN